TSSRTYGSGIQPRPDPPRGGFPCHVHQDEPELTRYFPFYCAGNPCAPLSPSARLASLALSQELSSPELSSPELLEDGTMPRVKQATPQKRKTKAAMKALGAAGLGLSLFGSASASTAPTSDIPQSGNTSPNQRFVLGEEE